MSAQTTSFVAQELERLFNGEAVCASDWLRMARNQNYLYALATGQTLPGASVGVDAHDHHDSGGCPIPFHQAGVLGFPMPVTYGAEGATTIRLARSVEKARFSVVKGTTLALGTNQREVAFLATESGLADDLKTYHQWILPGTTSNPHRYLRGPVLQDTLDWVVLYDALDSTLGPGPYCYLESIQTAQTFTLELPSWCSRLVVLLPMLLSAEYLLPPDPLLPSYHWYDQPLAVGHCRLERLTAGEPQRGPDRILPLLSPFGEPPVVALEIEPEATGLQTFRLRFEVDPDGTAATLIRLFASSFGKENFLLHHQAVRGTRRPAQVVYAMLRN